jgi:short-subunit dehydrogenase
MASIKYVVVTGASSGLGNAIAQTLSANGYIVFAGVRKEKDKEIFLNNQNVIPLILDISMPEQVNSAFTLISEKTGANGLFGLINNAGINYISAFELADEEKERQLFEVNLLGAMRLTRKLLPLLHIFVLSNNVKAKIINISSIGGIFGLPWEAAYHSSKFAMTGFSQSLRYELEALNISVCCFLPGGMKTTIFKKSMNVSEDNAPFTDSPQTTYYRKNKKHMIQVMQRFEKSASPVNKASIAIYRLLKKEHMPLRKYFGTDAMFIRFLSWLGLQGVLKNRFVKK